MATITNAHGDRFLQRCGERWHYVRRVPASVAGQDPWGLRIRFALRTDDLAVARAMRDALEKADHDLWAALLSGDDTDAAVKRYNAASRRAAALGFGYRPAAELAAKAGWQGRAERMEAASDVRTPHATEKAVLGGEPEPSVPLSQALKVYFNDIAASKLVTKSLNQRRRSKLVPERAVRTFGEVVSDKPIGEITREDAQKFCRYWRDRIAPAQKGAKATHTPSSGNRQISALRTLYREYFEFMGEPDRDNPFAGLNFEERTRTKRTRPPFPTA